MWRIPLAVLAIALGTNVCHALTLGMYWEDSLTNTMQLNEGETTRIAIYVDLLEGEDLAGFGFANSPIPGDPVTQTQFVSVQPNWYPIGGGNDSDVYNAALGLFDMDAQVAQGVGASAIGGTTGGELYGPGSFIVAYQTIELTDAGDKSDVEITFRHTRGAQTWHFVPVLIKGDSTFHQWCGGDVHTTYAGCAGYGDWGNPGWYEPFGGGQPTPNPLILQRVPEPHTLALLALGAIAIRRCIRCEVHA